MADYVAEFGYGPDGHQVCPVVTHDTEGHALVYCREGYLVRANSRPDFQGVRPAGPQEVLIANKTHLWSP
jgi:hypothetical protein